MASPLMVVAAVIEREGQILIGQRKRDTANHPLKWEFPGGKVEAGETPESALVRELAEELDIVAKIGPHMETYEFTYPASPRATKLLFFQVTEFTGEPRNLDFEQILWVAAGNLPTFDFLEGDVPFVASLAARA
jgi:8-oxo-dGTP diphosphatase